MCFVLVERTTRFLCLSPRFAVFPADRLQKLLDANDAIQHMSKMRVEQELTRMFPAKDPQAIRNFINQLFTIEKVGVGPAS